MRSSSISKKSWGRLPFKKKWGRLPFSKRLVVFHLNIKAVFLYWENWGHLPFPIKNWGCLPFSENHLLQKKLVVFDLPTNKLSSIYQKSFPLHPHKKKLVNFKLKKTSHLKKAVVLQLQNRLVVFHLRKNVSRLPFEN